MRIGHACTAFFVGAAFAAPLLGAGWTSAGPYGGRIVQLRARPGLPDVVFAMTPGGVYRSADRGETWSRAEAGVESTVSATARSADLLAFDPLDPEGAWLVDSAGALYHSSDAGAHWTPTGFRSGDSEVLSVVADSGTPQRIFLGTSRGVLRSHDGGATFETASEGLPAVAIGPIAADPADPRHLVAIDRRRSHFYDSADGGDHWLPASSPCDDAIVCSYASDLRFAEDRIYAVASGLEFESDRGTSWIAYEIGIGPLRGLSPGAAQRVLFGGPFGAAFTDDGFGSAQLVNDGLTVDGATTLEVATVQIAPDDPASAPWYAGTTIGGAFRRLGAGASWSEANSGLAATYSRAVAIDPYDSAHALAGEWNGVYTGESGRALYISHDSAGSWAPAAQPDASYVGALALDPTAAGTIYAGGLPAGPQPFSAPRNSGLYKSTDGGTNWISLEGGLPQVGDPPHGFVGAIRALALDLRSCVSPPPVGTCVSGPLQVVYAATMGYSFDPQHSFAVIRSADAGATWTPADVGLPRPIETPDLHYEAVYTLALAVDANDSSVVYVGTALDTDRLDAGGFAIANGVFRSDDAGAHWTFRSEGLPRYPDSADAALDIMALVAHPTESGTLWAALADSYGALRGAVYKTVDGGAHWLAASDGLDLQAVRALLVDPSDPATIYAGGTPVAGSRVSVFRSSDGGAHWAGMAGSPPVTMVVALALDPNDRGRLLAGTNAGVWRFVDRIFDDGFETSR